MEKEYVYVVYETDQWLSTNSRVLKSVCTDWVETVPVAENILCEYGMKREEDIPENDCESDSIESALKELADQSQYRGDDFGILIEVVELNHLPYEN